MSIRARIPALDRDIRVLISETLSPSAQSKSIAEFAQTELSAAQAKNRAVLGKVPSHQTFVDGQPNRDIQSVKPSGSIIFEFELVLEALEWIGEQLVLNSPVLTGSYANSHVVFADGVEVEPGNLPSNAREVVFVNTLPYARKIERGQSPQAPDGVYEAVAAFAKRRFGNIAQIRFSFRSIQSGKMHAYVPVGRGSSANDRAAHRRETDTRQPAIVVML